ncbi:MAG TPA: ACT domain-containing protein [Bacillota bacterium]|nr:ACT domain-containing protein [Bacillota bacterium]HPE39317.1 ACT domain-containing protein [Bacillota bacterium]
MNETKDKNKAIVTVVGCDTVGIIAKISTLLAEENININDITQTILSDMFTMIMLVDLSDAKIDMKSLSDKLDALGQDIGLSIRIQHTDLFHAMHRI